MAKTKAQPSKRSRAARRATSPSINTDKSLKDVQPPPLRTKSAAAAGDRPSVLAVHHSAGVAKKKTSHRKSHMSAKARRRREKGMEMAEAVMERTSSKVMRSLDRQRTVDSRRQAWDAINRDVEDEDGRGEDEDDMDAGGAKARKNKKQKAAAAADGAAPSAENGWETDEDIDDAAPAAAASAPVDDDLDEIL